MLISLVLQSFSGAPRVWVVMSGLVNQADQHRYEAPQAFLDDGLAHRRGLRGDPR